MAEASEILSVLIGAGYRGAEQPTDSPDLELSAKITNQILAELIVEIRNLKKVG